MKPSKKQIEQGIDVVIVGGCANGLVLKHVRPDAQWFELRRPDYIKPLAASFQDRPEIAHTSDKYELHPIELHNSDDPAVPVLFGIAVVEGQSLTWALTQLVTGFVNDYTRQLLDEGIIEKQ